MWVLYAIVAVTRIFLESGTNAPCATILICVKNVKPGGWFCRFVCCSRVLLVFFVDGGVILILTPFLSFLFVLFFFWCLIMK